MNYQSCCKTGSDLLDPCHCKRKKKGRISKELGQKRRRHCDLFAFIFVLRECETLRRQSAMVEARASVHAFRDCGATFQLIFNNAQHRNCVRWHIEQQSERRGQIDKPKAGSWLAGGGGRNTVIHWVDSGTRHCRRCCQLTGREDAECPMLDARLFESIAPVFEEVFLFS